MFKFRPHDWFNTETQSAAYGIQAKRDRGPWMHVRRGDVPLIFDTAAERDAELGNLRKRAEREALEKKDEPDQTPPSGPAF